MPETIWLFCGSDEPQKAFPPFMLAAAAVAMDMKVTMFFTMSGLTIVKKGGAQTIEFPGAARTLPEFIQVVQEGGGRMIACSAAFPMVDCTEEDLIDGVECGGVVTFLDGALRADLVLTYT